MSTELRLHALERRCRYQTYALLALVGLMVAICLTGAAKTNELTLDSVTVHTLWVVDNVGHIRASLTAATDNRSAGLFLVDPDGDKVVSGYFTSPAGPRLMLENAIDGDRGLLLGSDADGGNIISRQGARIDVWPAR